MACADVVSFFFQKKWPYGFYCPRCGDGSYYTISTRTLPLYQCRYCKHQTTVTAGTVMEKSRTPLIKWAIAIELLSSTQGINAAQLATLIGVAHKTAWNMLRRIRGAISAIETKHLLRGIVHAGQMSLGRWPSPYLNRSKEHVLIAGASVDAETGEPLRLKLRALQHKDLKSRTLTREGEYRFKRQHVHPKADEFFMLKRQHLHMEIPLKERFHQAQTWLNRLYHGLGKSYLQTYLDEYCFRWNLSSSEANRREAWYKVCLEPAPAV